MIASRARVLDTSRLAARVSALESSLDYMRNQVALFHQGVYAWVPAKPPPAKPAATRAEMEEPSKSQPHVADLSSDAC